MYIARVLGIHKSHLSPNDVILKNGDGEMAGENRNQVVMWLRPISKGPYIFSQDKQILLFSA